MNGEKDVSIILVGNKCDKEEERIISIDEGKQKASELSKIN